TPDGVCADCPDGALTPASPGNVNNCQLSVTLQRSKAFSVQTAIALRRFTSKTDAACRRSTTLFKDVEQGLEVRFEMAPAFYGGRIHRPPDLADAHRVHRALLPMEFEAAFVPREFEEIQQPAQYVLRVADQFLVTQRHDAIRRQQRVPVRHQRPPAHAMP